jgi:hypothetical protein
MRRSISPVHDDRAVVRHMDLFNILWVISDGDRWVSDFLIFPPTVTVLRIHGIMIQQLQEWQAKVAKR